MLKRLLYVVLALIGLALLVFSGHAPDPVYRLFPSYFPDQANTWSESVLDSPAVSQARIPEQEIEQRIEQRQAVKLGDDDKQILFGDTHVHTTNSADAFMYSLPMMQGATGASPPAYACDYARFISQLDFYFLTDHAESFTPEQWQQSIESVQQCNRLAGDPKNPDIAAFIGWEWTQVGATADKHYGHHNVLFKDDQNDLLPKRPIASIGEGVATIAARDESAKLSGALSMIDPRHGSYYRAYNNWIDNMAAVPACDKNTPSPELPANCFEGAATPKELYAKLDQWGFDTMVIPHGMSWGFYTPPNADWKHQLNADNVDADKTRLIEVFSGHGNSEVFRDFAARVKDNNGNWVCPMPQSNYLPACWQAGEIIRKRCLAEDLQSEECEQRAQQARHNYVQVDTINGFMTVPHSTPEEWLDAGQARDVFLPALNYRPRKSAQYGLALQNFDQPQNPLSFRWGFLASTDTHSAKAGHGFKQINRLHTTDATGARSPFWSDVFFSATKRPEAKAQSLTADQIDPVSAGLYSTEFERATSFLNTGGVAAVHANGRSREAIWDAMQRREVYGTSGHRILLWFNLLNADGSESVTSKDNTNITSSIKSTIKPMGSDVSMQHNPRFQVKAVGSFKQLPGCPDYVVNALEKRRLDKMSLNECYNPSDQRLAIKRIEVVKIRPQSYPDEPVAQLIEDKWKVIDCAPSAEGCTVEFEDPEFTQQGRNAIYYVRAIEEAIETINGENLRTTFDDNGKPTATEPCIGDYRTQESDECYGQASQRAWSSPIFVDFTK